MALQQLFHGTSMALPRHFHGKKYIYIYTFNNICDSIRFGREFKCLPYADLLLIIFKLSSYAFEETVHILQMNGLIGCVPVLDRLLTFYFPHNILLNEDFLCYTKYYVVLSLINLYFFRNWIFPILKRTRIGFQSYKNISVADHHCY